MTTIACSFVLKTVAVFVLAVLPVNVKTSSGKTVRGDLDGFSESTLLINQSGEAVIIPFDDLLSLAPSEIDDKTGPTYRVTLMGGSRIAAQDVSLADNHLVIEPRRQNNLRVPVKQVKSIRFRASAVPTDAQWLGIVDRDRRGDTLVIRRPGDRLDPQSGIVESIENKKVAFNLDGDTVDAPTERLEGVVFGGTNAVVEDSDIRVTDVYGSRWLVVAIGESRGDQPLQLQLANSLSHEIPLHQIDSIQWSGGVSLLANEAAASKSFEPYFKTGLNAKLTQSFFSPSRDGDDDLLIHGGSSIEYRIDAGYRLFAGTAVRDASVSKASEVTVQIELNGKPVWEEKLLKAQPLGFELPLDDARRLTIKVDSGNDGDLGDTVRISRPRLLK